MSSSYRSSAGTEVISGATVTLKYNPVNKTLVVPDFVGKTEVEIRATGILKQFEVVFAIGEENPMLAGKVCMQSIPAGQTVAYGTKITLTVAPAPAP